MKTKLLSALIIIVSQFVAYGQSISATISPNPVVAGNDVTIDVTFTSSNSTDIIQLNLERVNASYVYVSTVDYREFVVPSTGTDQTVQYTVSIPAGTTPSSNIGTDFYYYKIELRDSSYNWIAGYYEDPLTVNSTLSVSDFDSENVSVYPNPAETLLNITTKLSLSGKLFSVYSILGKEVIKNQFISNSTIDIKNLASGFYILKIENLAPIKFLKK